MATLYVTEPGARVEKEYQRLLVVKEDIVLFSIPLSQVSEVVLVGFAGITTPAMLSLLDSGTGLTLISRSGRLRGRLLPPHARNLPLRQRQFMQGVDQQFCLQISRAIVSGKLANSLAFVRRLVRSHPGLEELAADKIQQLGLAISKSRKASSVAILRGIEGSGARAYFYILRNSLHWPGELPPKRQRRPPKDPINALLSFSYSLLTNALVTACEIVGLDPYDGFFHADKYGRPALALDLVEEFRAIIADSIVVSVINNRVLSPRDFEMSSNGGVVMTTKGMKKFLKQFALRLDQNVYHPKAGRALSYQKVFEIQARLIRAVIEGKAEKYQPFRTR